MAKAKRKEPFGRPTKYKKEYCQGIVDYFKNFEPFEELPIKETVNDDGTTTSETKRFPVAPPSLTKYATSIDVSRETLHEWKRVHKDFSDAFGKAKAIYEDVYCDGAMLGYYNHGFTALIMKNRFDWADKSENKNKNENTDKPTDLSNLSDDDLKRLSDMQEKLS